MHPTRIAKDYSGNLELALQKLKYTLRGRFSHSNEEQILAKYIDELLPTDRPTTVVDIGAGNGVRWSNSYALMLQGWKTLGIEADPKKSALLSRAYQNFPNAHAHHSRVEPQNISSVFEHYDIEKNFGVLCLDIDGNDYWILDAILSSFRPGLIVTEINEKIPPPVRFVVKYDPDFKLRHHFYGFSIAALADLCARHGYGILQVEYNNAFLAPVEIGRHKFIDAASAYRHGYADRPDRKQRFALNFDMESLLSMTPEESIEFLREFYSAEKGNYHLSLQPDIPEMRKHSVRRLCPICQSEREATVLGKASLGGNSRFDFAECQDCATRYLSPQPSPQQLQKLYVASYYGHDWFKQKGWGSAFARLVLAKKPPGKFLDVGCGLGFFMAGIKQNSNWEAYGVEFAAAAVDFARDELGLDVRRGELVDVDYPEAFFDYIQVHNVLEHVRDPMTLLKECRRILKPDGVIDLRVPNGRVDSLDLLRFFKRSGQASFSKSGHIFFFPRETIRWMVEKAGLDIEQSRTYGLRRGLASLGLWPQLKNWKKHYAPRPLNESGADDTIMLPPDKKRPSFYYTYRMISMKARMLPGMREFGLDYELLLKRKDEGSFG